MLIMVYEEQDGRGAWDIPAGGIEIGETPEQALRRELQEEIGLQTADKPRLLKTFWALLKVPTVHFLYELTIDEDTFRTLAPNTSDIQKIDAFSQERVQELLDAKAYEHSLAKARLQLFLDGDDSTQFVCITGD